MFNTYGHLRTFDSRSLAAALPGCAVRTTRTYFLDRPYPRFLVSINQGLFRYWHHELALLCTSCGNERFPGAARGLARLSRLSNVLARILPRPRTPTRILMVFEKR